MTCFHSTPAQYAHWPTIFVDFCELAMLKWHKRHGICLVFRIPHSSHMLVANQMLPHQLQTRRIFVTQSTFVTSIFRLNNKIIPQSVNIECRRGACMCHARSICREKLHEKQEAWDWNVVASNVHTMFINHLKTLSLDPSSKKASTMYTTRRMSKRNNTTQIVLMIKPLFRCSTISLSPMLGCSTRCFDVQSFCSDAQPFVLMLAPLLCN